MTTLTDRAIAGGDKLSDMKFHELGIMEGTKSLSDADSRKLHESIKDHMGVMNDISKQSDGRIQWDTFPGFKFGGFDWKNINDMFMTHPVSSFINANPVIDGVPYENWDILKDINLDAMAGISRGMSEDRADKIRNVLERKTQAYQSGEREGGEKMEALDKEYLALEPVKIAELTTGASIVTDGTSESGQKLKDAKKQTSPTNVNAPFIVNTSSDDNSTKVINQGDTVALNNQNEYAIAAGLNEITGTNYMFGYG